VTRVSLPRSLEGAFDVILVGVFIVVAALAVHGEQNWNFAGRDTVIYSVAADLWSRGEVPYRDFIDHKPPAAYLAYRTFFFFGEKVPRTLWQGMTCLAAIGALFLYGAFRLNGRTAAAVSTASSFFLIVVTDPLQLGFVAHNNCETLAVFWGVVTFSLLLMYQRLERAAVVALAGSTFALAVLSKQTAACWIVPLGAQLATADWRLPWKEWMRRTAWTSVCFTAGGAMIVALFVAYFAAHDALEPFYEWTFRRNVGYATPLYTPTLPYRWEMILESYRWLLPKLAGREALPFVTAVLLLPLVCFTRNGRLARLAVLWCATSFAGASLGLGVQSHYFVLVFPALALAFGAAVEWLLSLAPRPLRGAPAVALLALALCWLALGPAWAQVSLRGDPARPATLLNRWPLYRLGREVAKVAAPDDRMLAFGDPLDTLFYSGLKPPGRYIYYLGAALQPDVEDYMRELRATEPRFIFIGSDTYFPLVATEPGVQGKLRTYLDEHYDLWLEEGGGRVFRRRVSGQ
jgi:hypothetical protein